jgi:hypothetical protein
MRRMAQNRHNGWADLVPAAALAVAGLGGLLGAYLWDGPATGQYLVVASNSGQALNAVRRADGGLVRAGGFGVVVAHSSHADFARRLRAAGAWLVVPSPFAAGCFGGKAEIAS